MTEIEKGSEQLPEEQTEAKAQSKLSILWEYVRLILTVVGVVLLVELFVIVNAIIPSASMEPTIMTGDHIFGNRLVYKFRDPQRYDIIIFRYPDDESQLFIKRVVGLPGETVEIRDGEVFVNGSSIPLYDDFCADPGTTNWDSDRSPLENPFVVPKDCYFVMGDNRGNSRDSRYWENPFVSKDKILGEAFFRYWPLRKMSVIHRYAEQKEASS